MSVSETNPSTYTIKSGGTFASIATRLGTSIATFEQANSGIDSSQLQVVQFIQLQAAGLKYTIQAGDTFSSIAANNGSTVAALEAANPLVNPTDLIVGSQIWIPASSPVAIEPVTLPASPAISTYIVQAGDTFTSIASNLGISVASLEAANPNVVPSNLQVGSILTIPTTSQSTPTPQPVTPTPAPTTSYTIQAGDTFTSIATNLGAIVAALEAANPNANPSNLQVGSQLNIPGIAQSTLTPVTPTPALPNSTYTIQAGDTISSIASNLSTTVAILSELNPEVNENALQIGTQISVPAQTTTPNTAATMGTYTIQAGDTFSSIAIKEGTTIPSLQAASKSTPLLPSPQAPVSRN
ncbi:uncharacterized protein LY89DRAFT_602556 [Mollisia scopiformis]|uniref:LysM domain-containing protein n=1 Tax=Mollisia scopiformis TaxID=149040 RepID=A0A132B3R6_MOLSC|nr:uncharacterized protein LY89DRAFT_602556 [Mollisia scopiformis]KUJ06893.1 hypothetical protein LY89DRAFT_602556 [Mollisia scopiformis]